MRGLVGKRRREATGRAVCAVIQQRGADCVLTVEQLIPIVIRRVQHAFNQPIDAIDSHLHAQQSIVTAGAAISRTCISGFGKPM